MSGHPCTDVSLSGQRAGTGGKTAVHHHVALEDRAAAAEREE